MKVKELVNMSIPEMGKLLAKTVEELSTDLDKEVDGIEYHRKISLFNQLSNEYNKKVNKAFRVKVKDQNIL